MKTYSEKHRLAKALALSGVIALSRHNRVKLMRPANLYRMLRENGWRWNGREWLAVEVQNEETRQPLERLPLPAEVVPSNAADVFMVRIMAHKSRAQVITAGLTEFAEVFDWQIMSVSDPYDNHGDGEFCRIYIRFRIRS